MAEDQDKQHAATPKRLSEMRKRGTVLRSKDLTSGLLFVVTILFLSHISSQFQATLKNNFIFSFSSIKQLIHQPDYFVFALKSISKKNFMLILPLLGMIFLTAFLTPFFFGGWNFTLDVLKFELTKLSPINNLRRLFSIKDTLIEIFRSILKSCLISAILVAFLYLNKNNIIKLMNDNIFFSVDSGAHLIWKFIVMLCFAVAFLAALDAVYHYYKFQHKAKMSSQEVKDEAKDMDGNVETKRRVRSRQLAILKQRLSQAVPQAHVVVTNPTHYAVALRYDSDKDRAPKVIAKGKELIAGQIRQLAIANGVPMYEAPILARALYHTTEINFEIHPDLYMAVAIVLSYVNQLKNYQLGLGQPPKFVNDFEIPKAFIFDE